MGVLRLLLALLVVYVHCNSPFGRLGLSAENAVQIFFMISGFYMTLVLREKYAGPGGLGLRAFYVNRGLRLLPAYFLVAAVALFLCVFSVPLLDWEMPPAMYLRTWRAAGLLEWPEMLWLGFSQLSMIGLETFNFFDLSLQGQIAASTSANADTYELWRLLLVPQAWSLSIELYFYLLAPFIVTRGLGAIAAIALTSFVLRLALWHFSGLYADPWSYRFFPTELMFFMLGAVAYHAYQARTDGAAARPGQSVALTDVLLHGLLAVTAAVSVWVGRSGQPPSPGQVTAPLITAIVFLALPVLFAKTRRIRADQALGELSYPIYISHFLIIWIVGQGDYPTSGGEFLRICLLTLLVAYGLYRGVDLPIDRWRHAAA